MKKYLCLILALGLLCTLLVGCGEKAADEKGGKKEEAATIVGTWEYSGMDAAYIFNADGTGAYRFSGTDMPFTYEDDGSTLTIQYENAAEPNVFQYTIKGNKLSIEDSFGSIVEYEKK